MLCLDIIYPVLFVFLFVSLLYSQVNSYGHFGMVSSPNHIFSCAALTKQLTSTLQGYFWDVPKLFYEKIMSDKLILISFLAGPHP